MAKHHTHKGMDPHAAEQNPHLPSRPSALHKISLDWHDPRCLQEHLERLGLLGESFLYSAIPPKKIEQVQLQGSYLNNRQGQPEKFVFCCHYTEVDGERVIAQFGSEGMYDIWGYLDDNADVDRAAVAIFDRSKLEHICRAEFEFVDKDNPASALIAIVVIENWGG